MIIRDGTSRGSTDVLTYPSNPPLFDPRQGRPGIRAEKHPLNLNQIMLA